MLSGPYAGEPCRLSPELLQRHRDLLAAHADDPVLGACPVCLESAVRTGGTPGHN